jgi:hypothetical protein
MIFSAELTPYLAGLRDGSVPPCPSTPYNWSTSDRIAYERGWWDGYYRQLEVDQKEDTAASYRTSEG